MKAEGLWSWWNQFGFQPFDLCVYRAKQVRGIIAKWGYWPQFDAFKAAGIRIGIERYAYPNQPEAEAQMLAEGINRGAEFAVINAEVEWEQLSARPMEKFIAEFRRLQPNAELYASVDTRGNRTRLPYQTVLGQHVTAWMPMIYPKAFRPTMPPGAVAAAFRDCLDSGQSFWGKPVLPTIQTYDAIGPLAVREQVAEAERRGLLGVGAYTVGHATQDEWVAFRDSGQEVPVPPEIDSLKIELELLKARHSWTALLIKAQGYAEAGEPWPLELRQQIHYVIHLAEQVS